MVGQRKDVVDKIRQRFAELEKELWANRVYHFCEGDIWYPNPDQQKLLDAWGKTEKKVFTFTGGNRKGKCVTYRTLIETPSGEVQIGELYERGKLFDVYAWDGENKVVAKASAPFKKEGLHKCYRITMSDGRWVEPADHHRILTTSGEYATVEQLAPFFPGNCRNISFSFSSIPRDHSTTTADISPSAQNEDGQHLYERESNYQGHYSNDFRPGGVPFQQEVKAFQFFSPLRDDVRKHNYVLSGSDVQENKYIDIHSIYSFLRSIPHSVLLSLTHVFGSLENAFYRIVQSLPCLYPAYQPLSTVGFSDLQLSCGFGQSQNYKSSVLPCVYPPLCVDDNHIVSINEIMPQYVYDCQVGKYHNYFAGGLVHHNTTIGLILALCVMRGEYLWSGEKILFPHNNPRQVLYVGQGWESHIQKVVEPELEILWPAHWGKIGDCTKKNNQGVKAQWTDPNTKSQLHIYSNNQESTSFEGDQYDLIIWDEPPRRDNRVAAIRGLIDRTGRELFVATIVSKGWMKRDIIKMRLPDGSPDPSLVSIGGSMWGNVSLCKCGEYIQRMVNKGDALVALCNKCGEVTDFIKRGLTIDGVNTFAKGLKKSEYTTRIEGGDDDSNMVLPSFNRDVHVVNRFKIPLNWITDISIDFHPSKAWAVLFVATAPNNIKYACHMISEKGNPKYIAEEIVRIVRTNELFVNSITIDPLSKGDENAHIEAETVYKIMEKVFRSYNYRLDTASKDKDNGIALTNDLLMTENEMPALYFFKDLGPVIEQVEDWMYDPETLKPSKENDDFCEVLYRIVLRNSQWKDPYDRVSRMAKLPQADMGQVAFG